MRMKCLETFKAETIRFELCLLNRFPSILPILETEYVVEKIVEAILTNQEALYLPRSVYLLTAMKG